MECVYPGIPYGTYAAMPDNDDWTRQAKQVRYEKEHPPTIEDFNALVARVNGRPTAYTSYYVHD